MAIFCSSLMVTLTVGMLLKQKKISVDITLTIAMMFRNVEFSLFYLEIRKGDTMEVR